MIFDIYNPHVNQSVTADYVNVIDESLRRAGHQTRRVDKLEKMPENCTKGVVCILLSDVRKAKKLGYGKIIRWVQGASEAESFMRHHSWLRFWVISFRHKKSLKQSDFILFCSETMKRYYEKKFHAKYDNSYIMPCFNDEIKREAFFAEGKYDNNVFVYAGSLETWQCFEPTVALYREVEKRVKNSTFRVLVKEHNQAIEILKKYEVERYSLDFVPKEQVAEEMARAKFGFCIREDSIVNRVATPTKLSSYIANGVMPVYSEYIESFHDVAKGCGYCFCANPYDFGKAVDSLVEMCEKPISPEAVYASYMRGFGDYFSREYHMKQLTEQLKGRDDFI